MKVRNKYQLVRVKDLKRWQERVDARLKQLVRKKHAPSVLRVDLGGPLDFRSPLVCMSGSIIEASSKLRPILDGLSFQDRDLVLKAREKVKVAFEGQKRLSGKPKFEHFENVAHIISTKYKIKTGKIIAAGYLHDYIEEMEEQGKGTMNSLYKELVEEFGQDVADLVLGVTKVSKEVAAAMGKEREDFNLYRLMRYFATNFGVEVIKLADDEDNSRDQDPFPEHKRKEHAHEAEDCAKIANASAIWVSKKDLEDNALKYLRPALYKKLKSIVEISADEKGDRKGLLKPVIERLYKELERRGLTFEVVSAPRNVTETRKVVKDLENIPAGEKIFEVNRLIILVEEGEQGKKEEKWEKCYQALGILCNTFRPVLGSFKDYIAIPKANGYQALIIDVTVPDRGILNVIIQTEDMHAWGEYGPITYHHKNPQDANWYKKDYGLARRLKESLIEEGLSQESLRSELDQIEERKVVFTPEMQPIELPEKGSYLDFAFRIHSEIGIKAVGAEVNLPGGKPEKASISEDAASDHIVRIFCGEDVARRPSDVFRVRTRTARDKIRNFINSLSSQERMKFGDEELTQILKAFKLDQDDIFPTSKIKLAEHWIGRLTERYGKEFRIRFREESEEGTVKKPETVILWNEFALAQLLGSGKIDPREASTILAETYISEMLKRETYNSTLRLLIDDEVKISYKQLIEPVRKLIEKIIGALPEERRKEINKREIIYIEDITPINIEGGKRVVEIDVVLHDSIQEMQLKRIYQRFGKMI